MDISVQSEVVEKVTRVFDGVSRDSWTQWALLQQGGFVLSFLLSHYDETEILRPGKYELDPLSFSSKNGRLTIERVKLKPLTQPRPAPVQQPAKP